MSPVSPAVGKMISSVSHFFADAERHIEHVRADQPPFGHRDRQLPLHRLREGVAGNEGRRLRDAEHFAQLRVLQFQSAVPGGAPSYPKPVTMSGIGPTANFRAALWSTRRDVCFPQVGHANLASPASGSRRSACRSRTISTASSDRKKSWFSLRLGMVSDPADSAPSSDAAIAATARIVSVGEPLRSMSPVSEANGSTKKTALGVMRFGGDHAGHEIADPIVAGVFVFAEGREADPALHALGQPAPSSMAPSSSAVISGVLMSERNRIAGLSLGGNSCSHDHATPSCESCSMRSNSFFTTAMRSDDPGARESRDRDRVPTCQPRTLNAKSNMAGSTIGSQRSRASRETSARRRGSGCASRPSLDKGCGVSVPMTEMPCTFNRSTVRRMRRASGESVAPTTRDTSTA